VHQLEKKIQDLEKRQAEITAELEKPETYQAGGKAMDLNREFRHNADEIARLTPKWEEAAAKLETADPARPGRAGALAPSAPRSSGATWGVIESWVGCSARYYAGGDAAARRPHPKS